MSELYQLVGTLAAAFAGGLVGGRKAFKDLRREVRDLRETLENVCDYLTERFGMPQVAKPKNGATSHVGLPDTPRAESREQKERN